jgi:hypothetical protein
MLSTYERLRAEVLSGNVRPEGLGAIVYHGLIDGLKLLCASEIELRIPTQAAAAPQIEAMTHDPELLRLLTNMVLQTQSEVMHVY